MPTLPQSAPYRGPNGNGQGQGQIPADLQRMLDEYDETLRDLRGELKDVQTELKKRKESADSTQVPRYIEDIPGKRVSYWWVISIPTDAAIADGSVWTGSQTLSQDGPFVINSTRAFWRVTTASGGTPDPFLRAFLPPCKLSFLIAGMGSNLDHTSLVAANLKDMPDWFFQFQLSGGDRLWQNSNIPSSVFTTDGVRPEYLGMPGWVERNDTFTVQMTASVAATAPDAGARGTMYIVQSGYKILRPIDFAESFGMNP